MLKMASIQEQVKAFSSSDAAAATLLDEMKLLGEANGNGKPAAKKVINSELWHACAGPLVSLPQPGSLVYYFPQGHSEQVTASTRKAAYSHMPNYPNLPSQLMCQVHNITLHADKDTDEIYAQMALQPVNSEMDVFPIPDFGHTKSKQPTEFFCKNLTASDTSTHGGFSVPRRAAEKLFPQLDYSMQPPNQELIVRDLHDNVWTFRHIYRGQPRRHLLTTGWSLFVGTKRLKAGDSVLFIRDEKSQLLLGIRRANRQQTALPSSVLSADSMHMGVLAAAAHAAASLSPFTVYYNPRACPSEFIVPLAKYHKAAYTQISIGMRLGMMFETEESTKRRYMGTIVGISDYDPLRWPNSKWRNLQVEWDEHGYGERPERVSLWEIETPESLFVFPTQTTHLKRQCLPGLVVPGTGIGFGNLKPFTQAPDNGHGVLHPIISGLGPEQLMKVLLRSQNPIPDSQHGFHQSIYASIFRNIRNYDTSPSCSSNLPTHYATRNLAQDDSAVNKTVIQQKHQFSHLERQMLPLQSSILHNQNRYCVQQQDANLDWTSWEHMKSQEQIKSLPEYYEQNDSSEHTVNRSGSKCEGTLLQETVSEKSDVASDQASDRVDGHKRKASSQQHSECSYQLSGQGTRESPARLSDHEILGTPFLNDEPQKREEYDSDFAQQVEHSTTSPWLETVPPVDKNDIESLVTHHDHQSSPYLDNDNWFLYSSCYQSFPEPLKSPEYPSRSGKADSLALSATQNTISSSADIPSTVNPETFDPVETLQFSRISDSLSPQCSPNFIQEFFGAQELNPLHELVSPGVLPFEVHNSPVQEEGSALQDISNSFGARDLYEKSINRSESHSDLHIEANTRGIIAGSCASSAVIEPFSVMGNSSFYDPSEDMVANFPSNHDLQSQVTSTSLADSQVFSLQEFPDSSGGTSSSSIEVNEHGLLIGPMAQLSQQPLRTYTKVQKLGSVGRSIDVTRYRNYQELTFAIACMFGLEGQLDDPRGSEWKLVYVDYENDVLLVGDDPWEEFVNCVRCIRILSPTEVQQMSVEGLHLMDNYIPPCQ